MSTNKWLRYEVARQDPLYVKMVKEATDRLQAIGYFSKEEIVAVAGLVAFADSIRWDYLTKMIKTEQDTELIPMVERFFHRHAAMDEQVNPQKYIASGYSKRTAGWALVSANNQHLVIRRLNDKHKQAEGVVKALNKTHRHGTKAGMALSEYAIVPLGQTEPKAITKTGS